MDTPTLWLTRAELEVMLDTVQPKRMCDRLTARGWVFEPPQRRGEIPKVSRAYCEARMSDKPAPSRRIGPRVDWMLEPQ